MKTDKQRFHTDTLLVFFIGFTHQKQINKK